MSGAKNYWKMKQSAYPFQTEVPHMSDADVDPRKFNTLTNWAPFLRVPFDGVAHWGFKDQATLDLFKQAEHFQRRVVR